MPNEEWGVKRVCPETGKRFYDLNQDPVISPYTGAEYPLSFFTDDKSKASMSDKADKSAAAEMTDDDLADDVDVLDDDAADVDIDDELLDDGDDTDTVPLEEVAGVASSDDDS